MGKIGVEEVSKFAFLLQEDAQQYLYRCGVLCVGRRKEFCILSFLESELAEKHVSTRETAVLWRK